MSQQQELLDDARDFGWSVVYRYTNQENEKTYAVERPDRPYRFVFWFAPTTGRLTFAKKLTRDQSSRTETTPVFSTALGWID